MTPNSKETFAPRSHEVTASGFDYTPAKIPTNLPDSQIIQSNVGTIKDLITLFSAIFCHSIAYGIIMVMIALKLEANVKNEVLISVSSAVQIIAGIVFARFLPIIGRKIGLINLIYCGSLISAVSAILLFFYSNFFLWVLLIYAYGTSLFICGVTRQTIMIDLAPKHMRAMVISLGGMVVALGNGSGPILLELIKTSDSFFTFALAGSLFLISTLPISHLKKSTTNIREEKRISVSRYIKNSPKIMFAGFAVNYITSSTSAFLIIYGIKIGMGQYQSSLLISIFLLGSILSLPIAYLIDFFNRRFVMIFCAVLSLIGISLLYVTSDFQKVYTLLFLTFGCLIGTKLSAVVLINDKYKSTQRLAVNSAFSRVSLTGNITGLFSTGIFMKLCGPTGLWISSICMLSLFLIFCGKNYYHKIKNGEVSLKDFSILNKKTNEDIIEV
jgi:MFS family permease